MIRRSIRWRIQVWHGSLLILLVTGLMSGFYWYERNARLRNLDLQIREATTPLLPTLDDRLADDPGGPGGPPDGPDGPPPPGDGPPDFPGPRTPRRSQRTGGNPLALFDRGPYYYVSWSADGALKRKSAKAPDGMTAPKARFYGARSNWRTRDGFRESILFLPNDDAVVIGVPTNIVNAELRELAVGLAATGLLILLVGLTGGWWLAGRALRPITVISAAAERIAGGDLSQRINVAETENELGQLAGVLNRSFERLEKTLDQHVQLNADASQELRTPVSAILSQIQTALSREGGADNFRDTLAACADAAKRMRVMVDSMLDLARVDSGEFKLLREDCDLGQVAREALDFIAPLARRRKVSLRPAVAAVKARADTLKLGQVLINLLTNAIQNNSEGIVVSLTVERKGSRAVLRVADNGQRIPRDALAKIFDRFYRDDKARTGKEVKTGLGMALCKTIVEAHGGTIRAESGPDPGSEFIVELPLED